MAKYVVTYTIHNDEEREKFVKNLKSVGLEVFPDQSVNYGSYDGSQRNGNIKDYLNEISSGLGTMDVVFLFEGDVIPNNQKTINCLKIK